MKATLLTALILAASSTVCPSWASAVPKANPKPGGKAPAKAGSKSAAANTKTVRVNDLGSSSLSSTSPGRTKLPLVGDMSPSPASFSVKMKPANGRTKATRGVAATSAAKAVNFNEPVSSFMRAIKVGANSPTPQLALGQALAVNGSYLVTSADFVAEAWTNSGDVKFFAGDSTQSLQLIGFDLPSNIAIFTTGMNTQMDRTLPLARLRADQAALNEDFTSLGASGLIGGARRASPVNDLSFIRERFDLPASVAVGGAAGTQFLFDRAGRWVGMTSLWDQRDGRRFDVTSAQAAAEMIRQLEQRPPATLPSSVLQVQASSWQERWTNTFHESARKGLALRNLECAAEPLKVEDSKLTAELSRTRLVRCHNFSPVSVTHDYALGFELVTGEVTFTKDVRTFLSIDTSPTTVFGAQFYANRDRTIASVNALGAAECEKSEVTNARGHHFHVRYCTSALKNAPGLNDSTVTVISSDTGLKSTLNSLHLRGFDTKNAKRFMEWMIESEVVQ